MKENTCFTTRFMCRTDWKPGCGRDPRHGQVGVVEEAPREVRPPRPRHLARGRADVQREQPAEMARAHAETGREGVLGIGVERAVGDETEGAAHELGRVDPTRFRLAIGAALQAGPEPVGLGGRRERVRTGVAAQRPAAAPFAAVDARGDDCGEL